MKIRSKLLLALLLVAIVPISVGCIFSYYNSRSFLTNSIVNHLKSVSSLQHARVDAIVASNLERLSLVSSRTQLRMTLAKVLGKNGGRQDLLKLNRILADALASVKDFVAISVYSPDGVVVSSTVPDLVGRKHFDLTFLDRCREQKSVDYFFREQGRGQGLYLSGPLFLAKKLVGVIVIESRVDNFLSLVQDYSGLGRTGETLIVKRGAEGDPESLLPTRFGKEESVGKSLSRQKNYAANYAFAGEKVLVDCIDYREQPVLAIGRLVEATGWGLVVKIDKDEAYAPVNSLWRMSVFILLLAATVVLLVALYVSAGISAPIDRLAKVAGMIANGDLNHKAPVNNTNDEVGVLARAFNSMVESLLQISVDLEKKVDELRGEVTAHEQAEKEKELLIKDLQRAVNEIRTLKGIVPICSSCKKIRDDKGFWNQIETYVRDHSEAEFSHGLCPDCATTLYPDVQFPEEMK